MIDQMSINEMVEAFALLDATNQSAEEAIAEFIVSNERVFSSFKNKKAFVANAIQAYAKLLQDAGVKV